MSLSTSSASCCSRNRRTRRLPWLRIRPARRQLERRCPSQLSVVAARRPKLFQRPQSGVDGLLIQPQAAAVILKGAAADSPPVLVSLHFAKSEKECRLRSTYAVEQLLGPLLRFRLVICPGNLTLLTSFSHGSPSLPFWAQASPSFCCNCRHPPSRGLQGSGPPVQLSESVYRMSKAGKKERTAVREPIRR